MCHGAGHHDGKKEVGQSKPGQGVGGEAEGDLGVAVGNNIIETPRPKIAHGNNRA